MALGGPQIGQVMWAVESTYGTAVTRTAGLPLLNESVEKTLDPIIDEGIIAGRRYPTFEQHVMGNINVKGSFQTHVYGSGMRRLFESLMGQETDPASGDPRAFTYAADHLSDDMLTLELNTPSTSATQLKIVDGCVITGATIEMRQGQLAVCTWDVVGQDMVTTGSATTLVIPGAIRAMAAVGMTVAITGSGADLVKQATLRIDNGLAVDRRFVTTDEIAQPVEAGIRSASLDLTLEHDSSTYFDQHVADTEAEVTLTLTDATHSLAMMVHGWVEAPTPRLSARTGLIEQSYKVTAAADSGGASADADALLLTYTAPAASL